jgi:Zn-dependent alcohol dehydrogenase
MTHTLALTDLKEGFDRLASGDAVRQVVLFDEKPCTFSLSAD